MANITYNTFVFVCACGIIIHYVGLLRTFPFINTRSYAYNEKVYNLKNKIGNSCAVVLFILLFALLAAFTPQDNWLLKLIYWGFIGFCALAVVIIPMSIVDTDWRTYHFQNFSQTVIGHIIDCQPEKCETQGEHYKKVDIKDNTCNVTFTYNSNGLSYNKVFKKEDLKILYTFEINDKVQITISSKDADIVKIDQFLFDRPITSERFKEWNYGEFITSPNSTVGIAVGDGGCDGDSGCGDGCGGCGCGD